MPRAAPAALLALCLFALYAACLQRVQYGDGIFFLVQLQERMLAGHNVLYLPILDAFTRASGLLGIPVHRGAALFSAACTAGGAAFLFLLLDRVWRDRRAALATTLLAALSPGVLFLATTTENHAHHLLWVAACLWAVQRAAVGNGLLPWLGAGLAAAGAYGSHQTFVLFLPGLVALALALRRPAARLPAWPAAGTAALLLLGPLVALRVLEPWIRVELLEGHEAYGRVGEGPAVFRQVLLEGEPPGRWPAYWWTDVVQPAWGLLAVAVLGALAVARNGRSGRLLLAAAAVAMAPYLFFFARWGISERGGYSTAVWPVLALLAARWAAGGTPARAGGRAGLVLLLALAGCADGWWRIGSFERADPYRAWVAWVQEHLPPGSRLLLAHDWEWGHAQYWTEVEPIHLGHIHLAVALRDREEPGHRARWPAATGVPEIARLLREGSAVAVDAPSWRWMEREWPEMAAALGQSFRREPLGGQEPPRAWWLRLP